MNEPGSPDEAGSPDAETYNPWSVVNLVFHHLADQGLHPVLGATGDPGPPAAALLVALGIEPAAEGNRQVMRDVREHLATIRTAVLGDSLIRRFPPPCMSHVETSGPTKKRCH